MSRPFFSWLNGSKAPRSVSPKCRLSVESLEDRAMPSIVFDTRRDGTLDIYTANDDGSNPTRLTIIGSNDDLPSWSPDGSKIAFRSDLANRLGEIYVMNADGTGVT